MSVFTKWAFRNKAAVSLLTVLILIIGVVSYFRLPMEFLPSADNPQVTIITMGQGTDSKTMESDVTSPIERAVNGIKGKNSIYSTTGDGFSKIDLFFEAGSDMKQAKLDVQEALSSVTLPAYISKPIISQLNTSMIPISNIAITFKDGLTNENLELVKDKIEPMYKDIDGVSQVQTYGLVNPVISVKIDNQKLAENQLSLQSVLGILQGQNTSLAIGEKNIDGKTSNIKVIGDLSSIETLKNLPVAPNVTLEDISSIKETTQSNFLNRFDGKEALSISITKDSHSNAVTISKDIEKVTKEINKKYVSPYSYSHVPE
ncbi:efflux RND transporter permease subunit [Neobacillus niacini]|uniref:efflux RND transporter permease subunit n=1 Tax=Neobacillus niacini TaxID=86668 RepID=UPI0028BEB4B8|nr:efflux RND transporter permease subunit [Neobacillus niacini]